VLVLLLLEAIIEFLRHQQLDADAVLPSERVVLAVALVVHVVRPHEPPDLGVFVVAFEPLPLGVAVVLERDGVVGESGWAGEYPLEFAVRFTPSCWFCTLYSSRSLMRCW
jgi:hypothetical protein